MGWHCIMPITCPHCSLSSTLSVSVFRFLQILRPTVTALCMTYILVRQRVLAYGQIRPDSLKVCWQPTMLKSPTTVPKLSVPHESSKCKCTLHWFVEGCGSPRTILTNFLAFLPSWLPSFQASVTLAPAVPNGPRGLIFSIRIGLDPNSTLFGKPRSRVKGQGHIYTKMYLFWANSGHKG